MSLIPWSTLVVNSVVTEVLFTLGLFIYSSRVCVCVCPFCLFVCLFVCLCIHVVLVINCDDNGD